MINKAPPVRLWVLLAGVIALWLVFGLGIYFAHSGWPERGQFGDMFGAANALFSALAFAILIYTMWLQREELALQRRELELTREELRRSADAQQRTEQNLSLSAWLNAAETRIRLHDDSIENLKRDKIPKNIARLIIRFSIDHVSIDAHVDKLRKSTSAKRGAFQDEDGKTMNIEEVAKAVSNIRNNEVAKAALMQQIERVLKEHEPDFLTA